MNLNIKDIESKLKVFAKDRLWEKYHTPKNLSMALSVEAAELMEIFQWLDEKESKDIVNTKKFQAVKDEVADIAIYLIRICDILKIDLNVAIEKKMQKTAKKYPIHLSKGVSTKYTDFHIS